MKFTLKQILLIAAAAILTKSSWAQAPKLKGKVFSEDDGKPLPGVTISIKAKGISIQSSSTGEFSLEATKGDLLMFTSIGYVQQVLVIGNNLTLEVFLKTDIKKLSDVVIVGYGTQKRSTLTGAAASVSNVEMQKLTVGNLGAAIQGRTPGVTVITDGGVAGSGVNILIRGTGSLTNISPLYVIDGTFASSLDGINSNDIESMEILKDAAAAAIYGSRAANGVVLITTKKGKEGVVKINLNSTYGEQTLSKKLSFINASQYVGLIKQVAASDGVAVPSRVSNFNPYLNQDYQSLWFGNAPMYTIGLNIEGGQKNSSFYSSLNYLDQKSILAFSDFKRYDFRLNSSQKINHLKIEEYISVNRTERHPNYTYSGVAYGFDIPIVPAKNLIPAFWGANSNGFASALQSQYFITNPPSSPNPTFTTSNMLATGALSSFVENETIFTGSLKAGYELFRGLVYSFGLNGYYQVSNSVYNIPNFTLLDVDGLNPQIQNRSYTGSDGSYFQYSMDNLLSYKKNIRRHDFDILLGQSWMEETSTTITNIAGPSNFVSNAIALPQGSLSTSSNQYGSALLSLFGRFNYDYDNRYLLSASARSDASSKFAASSRVGIFPSISAGWNIQNEHFFKSTLISLAKIRASYGELGANFIPPYSFVSTIRATVPVVLGDQSRGMGTITQTANPYIKWETTQSFNYGFDLGFLNNKITLTAEYFQKKDINLLASLTPPPSAGMGLDINNSTYYSNTASVQNKGIEISLGLHESQRTFKYDITANLSHIENRVLSLGLDVQPILGFGFSGSFSDAPTITKPGLPVGSFWGYRSNGIYQNNSDVPQQGIEVNKKAGDLRFMDINHDGVVNTGDKAYLGSPFPNIEYGLNFSGSYHSFDITLYFIGNQGNKIFNANKYNTYFLTTKAKETAVLNAWTPQNSQSNLPRITIQNVNGNDALPNSFYVENGSYLRLKNFQLGYVINKRRCHALPLERIRIFTGVQNLFTITHYSGYDPEVAVIPSETLNPAATGGRASSSFVLFNRGVDSRAYPRDRTYTAGFQVSF